MENIHIVYLVSNGLQIYIYHYFCKLFLNKYSAKFSLYHWISIAIIPVTTIIIATNKNTYTDRDELIIISILFSMNIVTYILFNVLSKYYRVLYENMLIDEQKKAYIKQIEVIKENNTETLKLQHDLNNHFSYMSEYLKNGQIELAEDYLYKMTQKIDVVYQYVKTNNSEFDAFLNYKLSIISKLEVKIAIDVVIPQQINISSFDLCSLLGNLLDNATNAFSRPLTTQKKELFLIIKYIKGVIYIQVKNSYDGNVNKKEYKGKTEYVTLKSNSYNHGIGMVNINEIVDIYNGKIEILDENYFYNVQILLVETNKTNLGTDVIVMHNA